MQRSALPWLILAAVAVSAALAWWTLSRPDGERAPGAARVEHRDLGPFHAIEVGGSARVTLVQGDGESIDVSAGRRGARVEASVDDGTLTIEARDRRRWWRGLLGGREREPAAITIHFRTLDRIELSGNVKLDAGKLTTPALTIDASGGSSLTLEGLDAKTLRVEGSGALQAELAGRVDEENVSISGAGSYRADRLRATDVTVSVSGVGNVFLHAGRTLRASISGAGVIEYVGDPKVTENVSGIGRVKRRESSPAPGMRVAMAKTP